MAPDIENEEADGLAREHASGSHGELLEIIARGRRRGVRDERSADQIHGYDADGLPA